MLTLTMLAKADLIAEVHRVADALGGILARPDTLAHPETLIASLGHLPILAAWLLLTAGVVCVSHGLRFYRPAVTLAALLTGLWLGYRLGTPLGGEVALAICLGLLFAVVAWPAARLLVVVCVGAAGAMVAAHAVSLAMAHLAEPIGIQAAWLIAALGFVAAVALAVRRFEPAVVVATSVTGAALMAIGLLAIALHVPPVSDTVSMWLREHPLTLSAAVAITSLAGLVMQLPWAGEPLAAEQADPA